MANDPFGKPMLKPTAAGGSEWYQNNGDVENDSHWDSSESFSAQNGYDVCDSSEFRGSISPASGFSDDECSQDQQEMVDRGYMQNPGDWKNVEFTGEFEIFNSSSDHITIGVRGARHTGDGGPRGCTGCNYKISTDMDGSGIQIRKESWHVSYHDMNETSVSGWSSTDGAFGLKILCYNSSDNQSVTIEVYLDKNNTNDFVKVLEDTDSGQVNSDAGECNCNDDGQPLVWGTPVVLIRGDEGEYGFKNCSVREIDPFGSGGDPGGDDDGGITTGGYNVNSITASGDDGNVPSNTRDGSFSTRWSSYNESGGEWIRFDLGSLKSVDEVKIAWYQGEERTNDFNIDTSPDGNTWTGQIDTNSSGNTTGFESYMFTSVDCRYVRITGHGNSSNEWVSITEVEIHGSDSDPDSGGGGGGTTQPPATADDYNICETMFALDYNAIGLCNPAE